MIKQVNNRGNRQTSQAEEFQIIYVTTVPSGRRAEILHPRDFLPKGAG
jgi:hypothetical protein